MANHVYFNITVEGAILNEMLQEVLFLLKQ